MDTFRCGHPRTPANCKPNGPGKVTCRACRRERDRGRPAVRRARQGREHNRYARYRRQVRNRIEAKRDQIKQLEQGLAYETKV